jgi:hypothetical protein
LLTVAAGFVRELPAQNRSGAPGMQATRWFATLLGLHFCSPLRGGAIGSTRAFGAWNLGSSPSPGASFFQRRLPNLGSSDCNAYLLRSDGTISLAIKSSEIEISAALVIAPRVGKRYALRRNEFES